MIVFCVAYHTCLLGDRMHTVMASPQDFTFLDTAVDFGEVGGDEHDRCAALVKPKRRSGELPMMRKASRHREKSSR